MKQSFITSYLTFYLKASITLEGVFIKTSNPTILKVIPLGSQNKTIPVDHVASVDSSFRLDFKTFARGIIFALIGLSMMQNSFIGGLILAAYGVLTVLSAFQTLLVLHLASGGTHVVSVVVFEKANLENSQNQAEDELEESLNKLKNINKPENAFAELEEVEAPEQNQELAQENSNKDIFENPSENLENTQAQNENLVEENSAQNISESQEALAEQNISVPTPENTQSQTAQPEVAPVFEQQNSAETSATQEIQTQNIQPVKNQGDEYYHPTENAQIASGLMGAQPYGPSGISREENSVATSNPQNNDYVLSHGKVQNAVYEEPKENSNFIPETNAYAQAAPVQPLSNFESSNPISNEQYAASNPAQNSNDFAMPMPPAMPDFNTMPMPPEIPNFDVAPSPAEQPAMGAQNSGDKIMTDQIYPNDPSQFRIPGM